MKTDEYRFISKIPVGTARILSLKGQRDLFRIQRQKRRETKKHWRPPAPYRHYRNGTVNEYFPPIKLGTGLEIKRRGR